jgi:hypothetical protein
MHWNPVVKLNQANALIFKTMVRPITAPGKNTLSSQQYKRSFTIDYQLFIL